MIPVIPYIYVVYIRDDRYRSFHMIFLINKGLFIIFIFLLLKKNKKMIVFIDIRGFYDGKG